MDYQKELEFAKQLALKAGEIGRRYFTLTSVIQNKKDNSPVTLADTEINSMVIRECLRWYPDYSILGEEESALKVSEKVWVCDPIDGTFPFTLGMPICTFCIALVVRGTPVLGVIYDFLNNRMFSAVKGGGAYLNGDKLEVMPNSSMKLIDLEYWHLAPYKLGKTKLNLFEEGYQVLNFATASYMSTMVALARAEAVIYGGDKAWDVAAAKVIVEELDCKVTDLWGNDQKYNDKIKGAIIARNNGHEHLVKIVEVG